MIRLLADISDLIDANISTLKEAYCLLFTGITVFIGALRFRMVFIFTKNVSISFDPCSMPGSAVFHSRNPISVSGVLVNPVHFEPLIRIVAVWSNEMEMFRIRSFGMAECLHMARQQEVVRLNLFCVGLAVIQSGEWMDHCRTTYGYTAYGRPIFKFQILRRNL